MSVVPIRPVFQDGQRLTAERLTQALEFLRTMLRRVLLAPLSSGVAGGFELSPTETSSPSSTLTIAPGLAIDGQGRLIVVPDTLSFSLADIVTGSGVAPAANKIMRVCLAQKENVDSGPCSPFAALGVEEGYEVLFREQSLDAALFDVLNSYQDPNSVPAWGDLDPPYATPEDSCVTLGHLVFADTTTFYATDFYRDGVSPRFTAIRNTAGTPSILLNELNLPVTPLNPSGKAAGVAVPVAAVFGPKPVIVQPGAGMAVLGPAYFKDLVGEKVQATHVSAYQSGANAGQVSWNNPRVFEFAGGADSLTKSIQSGLAGVSAVPIEFDGSNGPVNNAGEPLIMIPTNSGEGVRVKKVPLGASYNTNALIGVSAGPSYPLSDAGSPLVVPLARSGLVRVLVDASAAVVPQNSLLTAPDVGDDTLVVAGLPSAAPVVRAAQTAFVSPSPVEIFAWVL
ncbi:MAG: hypothetical protein KC766_07365 [Myxococcales bacterium]|nr:hypothetical protein [Myxococcales bacterium]